MFLICAPACSAKVGKPEIITREQWKSEPQPLAETTKHTPRFITIHHAGVDWKAGRDPVEFVKGVQKWGQKERGWPDLPYHFMIAPDGRIFEGRPLEYAPQSNTKYDLPGHVGIELMGNFETQRPSEAQLNSLVLLSAWVADCYQIDLKNLSGHRDVAKGQTSCPGKDVERYIKDGQLVAWVKAKTEGKDPKVKAGEPLPDGPTVVVDTPVEKK